MKIFLILILSTFIIAQDNEISLQRFVELGLLKSNNLRIEKSKYIASLEAINSSKTYYFPKIFFKSNYSRFSPVDQFSISIMGNSTTIFENIENRYNFGLSIEQPLFTGFRITSQNRLAETSSKIAGINQLAVSNSEALELVELFFSIKNIKNQVYILRNNLESLKESYISAQNYFENGIILKNEVLKINLRLSELESKLIDSEAKLQNMISIANQKFNVEINSETVLKDFSFSTFTNIDIEDYYKKAIENRNEIELNKLYNDLISEKESITKSERYPQLFLNANFNYSRPNTKIFPLKDEFNESWDINLVLSWEIFDWGRNNYQINQVREEKFQNEIKLNSLKDYIRIELINSLNETESVSKMLEVADLQISYSEENYKIMQNRFNSHSITSLELLDAQNEFLNAQIEKNSHQIHYEILIAKLNYQLGNNILEVISK